MKSIVSRMLLIGSFVMITLLCTSITRAQTSINSEEVKNILQDRIDRAKRSVGMVVGIVDDQGTRFICYGKPSLDSDQTVNANTVFEIGSVTKVFTAILLAGMVERGEVMLDDPISKHLPGSVKTPTRAGKVITLLDLATHTSGLPRMPTNFAPKDPRNPYANYTIENMYSFLSGYVLTRDIGSEWEYSNYGFGLLGQILAQRAGTNYEAFVHTRILEPLKMASTAITLTPGMQERLAKGHDLWLKPTPNWDMSVFAPAGGLRSTATDLVRFVAANLGLVESPLLSSMRMSHKPRHSAGHPNLRIGLGWRISNKYGTEITWHGGGTYGYTSFIGIDEQKRKGVVVLSNSGNDVIDIGAHLLCDKSPVAKLEPRKEHKAIKMDANNFDVYVGEYELGPDAILKVSRDNERFFIELANKGREEIFPESKTDFFSALVDAQITFVKDSKGNVTGLVLHQDGDHKAKKTK
jgi:CubicO group peptidase (beta-lactamase class C family)